MEKFERDLVELQAMKAKLASRSRVIAGLILLQLLVFFSGVLGVLSVLMGVGYYVSFNLLATFTLTLFVLFFILISNLASFEKATRSARIYSAEFSDSIGWYSTAAGMSQRTDGPPRHLAMTARITLREIAENSYLPLSRSESAPLLYIAFSFSILVAHVAFIFITRRY